MTTLLQTVVFPTASDPDVLPLYADPESWTQIGGQPVRLTQHAHIDNVRSRTSAQVPAGRRVSYLSYFNAFPAAYWQRWTVVNQVTLTLRTEGPGTVNVYRSNSGGVAQRVDSRPLAGSATNTFDLPLSSFSDGGWYWFELIASTETLVLEGGTWTTEAEPVTPGKLSIGTTTYNKPDYCVRTLGAIAADAELLDELDRVFIIDQGTQKVKAEDGFAKVKKALGAKLQVIEQGNIGGSGGFARSMSETLGRKDSDFLLLLDDDVEIETESILRATRFARFNREPTIVGGHMFDLLDKPRLHAWAEVVRPGPFMWGPSFMEQHRHDFRRRNLKQTSWMHARLDADYNGWWMCLIPKKVIEEIGLALPLFIKWDDAEYGLRARDAGIRTVTLPGMALWHVSWLDKDDTQDWQAFFHTRNRIIAGLLHSNEPRGGTLMQNSGRQDIKKLLNMQYYAVQLAVDGMRAVLDGPEQLHAGLRTDMPRARARAKEFPETRVYRPGDADTPVAVGGRALPDIDVEVQDKQGPKGALLGLFTARALPAHWRRTDTEDDPRPPELEYAKVDAMWWRIPAHRSVIVGAADGSGKMWYRHDRAKFRRLLREARALRKVIERDWDKLAAEYRSALPQVVSVDAWQRTFRGE